jgi:hypothetical protein
VRSKEDYDETLTGLITGPLTFTIFSYAARACLFVRQARSYELLVVEYLYGSNRPHSIPRDEPELAAVFQKHIPCTNEIYRNGTREVSNLSSPGSKRFRAEACKHPCELSEPPEYLKRTGGLLRVDANTIVRDDS